MESLMKNDSNVVHCAGAAHFQRRTLLKLGAAAGLNLLTPLAAALAQGIEGKSRRSNKALIVLWLEGAPSQLETFDPHPGTEIAAGSRARKTNVGNVMIGDGFEQLAEQMDSVSLVRAVTSREGDHARAIYNIKTGFRPDPTLVHPAIGSVICHQTVTHDAGHVDIPRHISILAGQAPGRGGYLGDRFDAFKVGDPRDPIPDVRAVVDEKRQMQRIADLQVVDQVFRQQHRNNGTFAQHLQQHNLDAALKMMSSQQLQAFDVSNASRDLLAEYGDTPFGRGCLAAIRLIQAGVRCVEVTLGGWDTHINNHELQAGRIAILDPAFAALIRDLKRRDMLDSTMVLCGGEFGRTPFLNAVGGRDHWPHGFSVALAGGGIQGGRVVGETNPMPKRGAPGNLADLKDPHAVEDIHATILKAMNIDLHQELDTPIGRPMKINEGRPIDRLLDV